MIKVTGLQVIEIKTVTKLLESKANLVRDSGVRIRLISGHNY